MVPMALSWCPRQMIWESSWNKLNFQTRRTHIRCSSVLLELSLTGVRTDSTHAGPLL